MPEYRVVWEIDLEADDPEDAARRAVKIQMNEESTANVFTVTRRTPGGALTGRTVKVDLDEIDGRADL